VSENRARYPIAVMCRVLDVSASGYYAWVKRPPSMRAVTDAALTAKIHAAHVASNGTYGAPRLQIDLAEAGIRVGRKRVARLMRNAGLVGVSRRKSTITTVRDGARQAPDLVDRNFTADRPNLLWVADITYIPTWAGFLYLAVVLDVFSRRIVGSNGGHNAGVLSEPGHRNRHFRMALHRHGEQYVDPDTWLTMNSPQEGSW
jgi:putative transposase